MKVLLINTNRMKPAVAPIGLDYLADALAHAGHNPRVLDLCFADDIAAEIARTCADFAPEIIGLTLRNTDDCYLSSQRSFLPDVAHIIRLLRTQSDAPIALGGVGYSVAPIAALDRCGADFGIAGAGEQAFPALLEALRNRDSLDQIPGLVHRQGNHIRRNPTSDLPQPAPTTPELPRTRSWIDNRRYFAQGGQAGIQTKRGCAARCCYCADPVAHGHRVHLRSPTAVVAELEALLAQGIDHIHTCDSEFNLPPGHALEVAEAIARAGLGSRLRWYAYCSPAPFDDTLIDAFLRAGCAGINFGVDHGTNDQLRRLGRQFTVADLEQTAALCHRHRLPFMFDLLLGAPGETRASIQQTIELMHRLEPDCVGLSVGVRLYAGTPLARQIVAQGPLAANPNLLGAVHHNPDLLDPVFYLARELGPDWAQFIRALVRGDPRFFLPENASNNPNYNYNDNTALVDAIARGARGAYWDILRRLRPDPFP
jgi:radical SAM superfamily enzyme YgiQ (UPF0313 family)